MLTARRRLSEIELHHESAHAGLADLCESGLFEDLPGATCSSPQAIPFRAR
jgi:hypothetical protein